MEQKDDASREWTRYIGLGLQLPLTILAGTLLGWWLDKKLGTGPWLLIAGAALGMIVGFISFITIAIKGDKNANGGRKKGP